MARLILVSGAHGFIGRPLCARLRKEGFLVRPVKNVLAPFRPAKKPHAIVHLAAINAAAEFIKDPLRAYRVNIIGTFNMLELARTTNAHFIFTSSSAVYGRPKIARVSESHPAAPFAPYGQSKYVGEILCEDFASAFGVPVTVLRLFNVYGPRQKQRYLIPELLNAVRKGTKIKLRQPNFRRDYLYVDDVAGVIARMLKVKPKGFQILNAGSGESVRGIDLIRKIESLTGKKIRWRRAGGRQRREVPDIVADTRRAKKILGWTPQVSLSKGLKKTFAAISR